MSRKLYIGPRLRRMREQAGLSQQDMATRLGISLSYVSQLENNQRPVSAAVLLKLVEVFDCELSEFSEDQDKRLLTELQALFRDRTLLKRDMPQATLVRLVEQVPEIAAAFVELAHQHQRLQDEYAHVVDRVYGDMQPNRLAPLPHEEVRDFLNRRDNYIESLDRSAERLADVLGLVPRQRTAALREELMRSHRIEVVDMPANLEGVMRRFDPRRRRLMVAAGLSDAQRAFQIATQYALITQRELIEREIAAAGMQDEQTCALARQGLAHYFAGALLLPYTAFLETARAVRYDIEALQQHFAVSFETVCHRLSTLQRSGARGVPFYFVRVDQAGNISKRQSATSFHFARHGGACPLWHVHEAFAHPARILTQVAEMPDGTRFFGIARTIERGGGSYRAARKLFAIGLGCELSHAHQLVYADGIDLQAPHDVVPIGSGCRVCPRAGCVQRAFPPTGRPLETGLDVEWLASYRFESDAAPGTPPATSI